MSKSALARKLIFAVFAVLLPGVSLAQSIGPAMGPLRVLASNPRYFTNDDVHAVYLTGSHTWHNLQDWGTNGSPQAFDFDGYVNSLKAHGHNFTLLWRTELPFFCNLPTTGSSPPNFTVAQHPWQRTGPGTANDGGLKFDLRSFDQSFFDRVRDQVIRLGDAGIYVGVYLFTGEWLNVFRCSGDGHPLTGANNINSIDDSGGAGSVTISGTNAITDIQDTLIEKYVDTLNDLDNVLWIVSEEAPTNSGAWNANRIAHLRNYEMGKPKQHLIGFGTVEDANDTTIINSNADWVAPNTKVSSPTPLSGSGTPAQKITINDSDHPYFGMWNETPQQNRNVLWQNFMNGVGGYVFMDPWTIFYPRENRNLCANPSNGICSGVDTRWDNFRDNLGATLRYSQRIDLARATPQPGLCSTGFCLANGDTEFLVYQPNSGSFTVTLSARTYNFEWFDPARNAVDFAGTVTTIGGSNTFTPRFSGDAVLLLQAVGPAATVAIDTGPSSPTNQTSATFTFHATGSVSGFSCKLDAGSFSSCTTGKTYQNLSDGSHTFQVKGTTANGDVGPVSFNWTVDATPPSNIQVSSPGTGQTVSGTILLKASAQDGSGTVAKMEFYIDSDSTPACSDTSAKPSNSTFQCSWNSAGKPDGPHSVKAKAFDALNNAARSAAVTFNVGNSGPQGLSAVEVITPTSGQKVSGSFILKGSAHDASGTVQKMEFYIDFDSAPACIDNAPKSSGDVFQCGWNTATKGNGAHMVTVKAYNGAGESAFSNAVSAVVDNQVISMVSPNGGETLRVGSNQVIQWNSGGITGDVKIEVLQNGTWKTIVKKTPNDGTQKWKVKKPITNNAQIRVCTLAAPVICGESAAVFSIADKSK